MPERLFDLFDEYAAAYARGERPSADEYLQRAGEERDELATLLGEFLSRTPAPVATEDDVRMLGLMVAEEPPLLKLRLLRRMKVDDVVTALIKLLTLDPEKRPKVKQYYQRLEGGLLEPAGVSSRVHSALAEILGPPAEHAAAWSAPAAPATAFLRKAVHPEELAHAPASRQADEDEIDRLFTGGNDN